MQRWPAFCAALGLAAGASFWRSAVFAEVYSLAAVMAALTTTLLLWWGARGGPGRLLVAIATFAVGLGNHLILLGLAPASALYVLLRDRRVLSLRLTLGSVTIEGSLAGGSNSSASVLRGDGAVQMVPHEGFRTNGSARMVLHQWFRRMRSC